VVVIVVAIIIIVVSYVCCTAAAPQLVFFPLKNSLTTKVRGVNSFITPTVPYTVGVDMLNVIIQNYTTVK